MVRLPSPAQVPVHRVDWDHASRLVPARFKAADCFERILAPEEGALAGELLRLAELTAVAGGGDLRLMDPSQVLFGPGAGWINASFTVPRAARFSTPRQGAFYVADQIETSLAEVRHHLEQDYRREGITQAMDLDYRALAVRVQGDLHDLRGQARTRPPWSSIYDPNAYDASQAFAATLREAGARGLAYDSVRHPGGTCAAIFDPNLLRNCRHDTYLAFRWDGRSVTRIMEKRMLAFR